MNIRTRRTLVFTAVTAVLFVALTAARCGDTTTRIENTGSAQPTGITVSGDGKATGKPDIAQITLGVSVLANSVQDARDRAAASLDAIIAAVKKDGVAADDIQTQQLYISPEYDYSNGKQTPKGFRVTNIVVVKLRDINKTSQVVDDAVSAGGDVTQVQGISFTIDKPADLQRQAREAAVADAKAKADTLAKAAGISVGAPISVSEVAGSAPVPLSAGAQARDAGGGVATPIEPGTLDVTVSVTVTWAIK
jgi:uncharacterized protein YggE